MELTVNNYERFHWSDAIILKLDYGDAQIGKFTKCHLTYTSDK